jgi:sulfur carrier protein
MKLRLNGEVAMVDDEIDLAGVVRSVTDRLQGIAVAVNGEVVPRSQWREVRLHPDDSVEVLTAAQGG